MATKKNKTVKKENPDKKFKEFIKSILAKIITTNIDKIFIDYTSEDIDLYLNLFKETYYKYYEDREDLLKDEYMLPSFMDYVSEGLFLYKNNKADSDKSFKYMKQRITKYTKDNNIGLQLPILISNITEIASKSPIDFIYKGVENIDKHFFDLFGTLLNEIAIYCGITNVKIKNRHIICITNINGELAFKYDSYAWINDSDINSLKKFFIDGIITKDTNKVGDVLLTNIYGFTTIFKSYSSNDDFADFVDNNKQFLLVKESLNKVPLMKEGEYVLDIDSMFDGINQRKYGLPKNGAIFKVVDNTLDVEEIILKEDSISIYVTICLKNSNNIYIDANPQRKDKSTKFIDEEYLNKCAVYNKPTLNIKYKIDKYLLSKKAIREAFTVCSGNVFFINDSPMVGNTIYLVYACIYLAFNNPYLFRDVLKPYAIDIKLKNGYTKAKSYHVAYIRKLPKNAKASNEALALAKKEDFIVPHGYTFVSAANLELKDDAKAKIIHIK